MTVSEFLTRIYAWGDTNAALLLAGSVLFPLVGAVIAWIGKGGRTDADGRFIASVLVGLAILAVVLEAVCLLAASSLLGLSLLQANLLLLVAPVLCLATTVVAIRLVFPLSQLGSVQTARDLGGFLLACGVVMWLLSMFRGWGVVFFGSLFQLVVLLALGAWVLRRLYRRAFGGDRRLPPDVRLMKRR